MNTQLIVAEKQLRAARSAARAQRRESARRDMMDLAKIALANPLLVGAAALALNEAMYQAGLYEPKEGEREQSELGGPVWFKIGPSLPAAQAKRNFFNTFIIGVTTAQAMAPTMPAIIQGGTTVAKALAAAV